jgi:hypothetical protein
MERENELQGKGERFNYKCLKEKRYGNIWKMLKTDSEVKCSWVKFK